jgi:hypothetical protein
MSGAGPEVPSFISYHTPYYRYLFISSPSSPGYSFSLYPFSIYYIFTTLRTSYSQPLPPHTTESKPHLYLYFSMLLIPLLVVIFYYLL